jgi:hypothetical protein
MSIPGVLVSGVPGAGGYDAVYAIVVGKLKKLSFYWFRFII